MELEHGHGPAEARLREATTVTIAAASIGLRLVAQQLAADTEEQLDRSKAAIIATRTNLTAGVAAIGNFGMEVPIISTASTGHIKAAIAVDISRIKATTIAGIALVTDRIDITFYLYYKNLNYFAT